MRDGTKRIAVAVAGLAIAGGAVLASAPAEAATTAGRTAAVGASVTAGTAAGWDHDDERRGHHGSRHWKHYEKRYHHESRHHRWRDHGRYHSYREAYSIGERYRGSSWESFNCHRVGGSWVLRVYG